MGQSFKEIKTYTDKIICCLSDKDEGSGMSSSIYWHLLSEKNLFLIINWTGHITAGPQLQGFSWDSPDASSFNCFEAL